MFGLDGARLDHALYLVGVLLVVSLLAVPWGRIGVGRLAGYAAAWAAIFAAGWMVVGGRDDARRYFERAQATDTQVEAISDAKGGEVRVVAALDGHFWVRATVNGEPVRFLVDTGASDVVLSAATARRVGIDTRTLRFDRMGISASGHVRAADARVRRMVVGPIVRTDMPISILDGNAEINLMGMRFLRTLTGWRVERDTLILVS